MKYIDIIIKIAEINDKIVLIDCDLAKCFESYLFEKKFPERYFNFGISEQNAISIAAGLASMGFIPIVQMFSSFLTTRSCDQIRNCLALNNLNVILIGNKAGFSDTYGGATHQSIDDIGILSSIPNVDIYSPIDLMDFKKMLLYSIKNNSVSYFRFEDVLILKKNHIYNTSNINTDSKKLLIVTCGEMLSSICINAINKLKEENLNVNLLVLKHIKPLNEDYLIKVISKFEYLLVIENHTRQNGIASKILMLLNKYRINKKLYIISIEDCFTESGTMSELLKKYGMSEESIIKKCKLIMEKKDEK